MAKKKTTKKVENLYKKVEEEFTEEMYDLAKKYMGKGLDRATIIGSLEWLKFILIDDAYNEALAEFFVDQVKGVFQ